MVTVGDDRVIRSLEERHDGWLCMLCDMSNPVGKRMRLKRILGPVGRVFVYEGTLVSKAGGMTEQHRARLHHWPTACIPHFKLHSG